MADHVEAVEPGHLHVEEHEVRRVMLNRRHRLRAVAALADDFDVLFLLQQRQHALARERLVVDDQGPDLGHATLSMSVRSGPSDSDCPGRRVNGMTTVTASPPPGGAWNSKR